MPHAKGTKRQKYALNDPFRIDLVYIIFTSIGLKITMKIRTIEKKTLSLNLKEKIQTIPKTTLQIPSTSKMPTPPPLQKRPKLQPRHRRRRNKLQIQLGFFRCRP